VQQNETGDGSGAYPPGRAAGIVRRRQVGGEGPVGGVVAVGQACRVRKPAAMPVPGWLVLWDSPMEDVPILGHGSRPGFSDWVF
jgi:hypothetical protein